LEERVSGLTGKRGRRGRKRVCIGLKEIYGGPY
jgi:hypothetical protein